MALDCNSNKCRTFSICFANRNIRIHFGKLGDALVVSPRFHSWYHAIGIGPESKGEGSLGGHNYGVLFSFWDMLFCTTFLVRHSTTPMSAISCLRRSVKRGIMVMACGSNNGWV